MWLICVACCSAAVGVGVFISFLLYVAGGVAEASGPDEDPLGDKGAVAGSGILALRGFGFGVATATDSVCLHSRDRWLIEAPLGATGFLLLRRSWLLWLWLLWCLLLWRWLLWCRLRLDIMVLK